MWAFLGLSLAVAGAVFLFRAAPVSPGAPDACEEPCDEAAVGEAALPGDAAPVPVFEPVEARDPSAAATVEAPPPVASPIPSPVVEEPASGAAAPVEPVESQAAVEAPAPGAVEEPAVAEPGAARPEADRHEGVAAQAEEPPVSSPAVEAVSADPTAERVEAGLFLARRDRRLIQSGLAAQGFDPGPADGLFGDRTRGAIGRWQASRGESPTGYLDAASAGLLLRSGAPRAEASIPPPLSEAAGPAPSEGRLLPVRMSVPAPRGDVPVARGSLGYRVPLVVKQAVPDRIQGGVYIPAHDTYVIMRPGHWVLEPAAAEPVVAEPAVAPVEERRGWLRRLFGKRGGGDGGS